MRTNVCANAQQLSILPTLTNILNVRLLKLLRNPVNNNKNSSFDFKVLSGG